MKLGRLLVEGSARFAASLDGDVWFRLDDFDIRVGSTGEAIQRDTAIREALETAGTDPIKGPLQFLAPIVGPEKMFGIGHNYMDHIRETGATPPDKPVVFA